MIILASIIVASLAIAITAIVDFCLSNPHALKNIRRRVGVLNRKQNKQGKRPRLSDISTRIVREYHDLPEANRPPCDIYGVATALDTAAGGVDQVNLYYGFPSSLTPLLKKHDEVLSAVQKVAAACKQQQRAIEMAGIDMDSVDELVTNLRRESEIVDDITKELT